MRLDDAVRTIAAPDAEAMRHALDHQARLAKPVGSLGALEQLSVRLAGLAGCCPPPVPARAAVAVFAGDHGVHARGVTPWPQEVTGQMVATMLSGAAVVNAFARQAGVSVIIVDVGVAGNVPMDADAGDTGATDTAATDTAAAGTGAMVTSAAHPAAASVRAGDGLPTPEATLWRRRVRAGTRDMVVEPAMTRAEAVAALEVGLAVAEELVAAGHDALLTGDMGIANTTPAAALIAAFTGTDPAVVTGRGTGIDDATLARKTAVIAQALDRHRSVLGSGTDPVDALAAVGGLEHAAIAGFILGAAALRVPVILDGVIAGSAALVAAAMVPDAVGAMIAGHRSAEPGASVALAHLGLVPVVDLGLRLGEGTGAVLALPIVASAARVLHDVATLDAAGVSAK